MPDVILLFASVLFTDDALLSEDSLQFTHPPVDPRARLSCWLEWTGLCYLPRGQAWRYERTAQGSDGAHSWGYCLVPMLSC